MSSSTSGAVKLYAPHIVKEIQPPRGGSPVYWSLRRSIFRTKTNFMRLARQVRWNICLIRMSFAGVPKRSYDPKINQWVTLMDNEEWGGDRSPRRSRDLSYDRSSKWKSKSSRRGGNASTREKSTSSKKAREEQEFLTSIYDGCVFSTLDLIFVVSKHLFSLVKDDSLPLDVYELRRDIADHFEGSQRLRFNTVCNINALCSILKYLSSGSAKEGGAHDEDKSADGRGGRAKRRDTGNHKELQNGHVKQRDTASDSHISEGAADDRNSVDSTVVSDVNSTARNEDLMGRNRTSDGEIATTKRRRERKEATLLSKYLDNLPDATDQSFREFDCHQSLIDLDVKEGLLYIIDLRSTILKRTLLKNRKKQRVFDLSGIFPVDSSSTNLSTEDREQDGKAEESTHDINDAGDVSSNVKEVSDAQNNIVAESTDGNAAADKSSNAADEASGSGVELAVKTTPLPAISDDSGNTLDGLYKVLWQDTARELTRISHFQLKDQSGFREICAFGTRADCRMQNPMSFLCKKVHFKRIILPNTLVQLGDCSYLDTCRHIETCRFVHYQVESDMSPRPPIDMVSQGQWICCDVRKLDFSIFNPFVSVVMADPPWDIHMDLPYGTMKDSEMRHLKVQNIQNEGLLFLWVTGRTLEVGRECMEIWGYRQLDEIVWVKTNQLQRIIRTGRTGHWLNHSKEHCLIGIKGNPVINRFLDCDVVVSEVRETSRKPDEIYGIIERMVPGALKLEIFGNQLDGYKLTHPEIKRRYEETLSKGDVSGVSATASGVDTVNAVAPNAAT
ncbi:N6-adenosine-methyltransferase 70 kDa subunit [Babesia sp. Xinjiang]|uniref:N6-adenosine-methyltransferase 70 kDa subunit n=1 Tax=Babesia sp. Xinjiang TaxID=462227 RepID=UPI000A243345|nr:N6-adenosine-methyltransferase 70 kDa subunit [Babesia sp. Xinjiang]ORM41073.1 N6-adenosine-methyltransferase 70 kDa subunit [Babesia sp. Xinjiang]